MRTDVSSLKKVRQRHQSNMMKSFRGGKSGILMEHLSIQKWKQVTKCVYLLRARRGGYPKAGMAASGGELVAWYFGDSGAARCCRLLLLSKGRQQKRDVWESRIIPYLKCISWFPPPLLYFTCIYSNCCFLFFFTSVFKPPSLSLFCAVSILVSPSFHWCFLLYTKVAYVLIMYLWYHTYWFNYVLQHG